MRKAIGMAVLAAALMSGTAFADSFSISIGGQDFSLGISAGDRYYGHHRPVARVYARPVIVYEPVVVYNRDRHGRRLYSVDRHSYCNEREHGWHGHHGWE